MGAGFYTVTVITSRGMHGVVDGFRVLNHGPVIQVARREGQLAQRLLQSPLVVPASPSLDHHLRMGQTDNPMLVQTFIAQALVDGIGL